MTRPRWPDLHQLLSDEPGAIHLPDGPLAFPDQVAVRLLINISVSSARRRCITA